MPMPRSWFRLRTALLAVAACGVLSAWPGRWVYDRARRSIGEAEVVRQGGSLYRGDRGYAVMLGKAAPSTLAAFQDATSVDLAGTGAGDADLDPLRGSKALEFLNLTGCPITDEGLARLAGATNLKYLFLGGTRVTDEGLRHVAGLARLEILVLDGTRVGDAGLARFGQLNRLRNLALWGTRATDRGALALKGLARLESISLPAFEGRPPTSTAAEALEGLPGVAVYRVPTPNPR